MRFSLTKLLAIVLVLGLLLGCLAACSGTGADNGTDNSGGNHSGENNLDNSTAQTSGNSSGTSHEGLEVHFFQGLTYFISEDFDPSAVSNDEYALWVNGSAVVFCVSCEYAPTGVTSSLTYATHYLQQIQSQGYTVTTGSANGVYYTLADYGDGTYEVRGFYVNGEYGWNIYLTSYNTDQQARWIEFATMGEIDTGYTPDLGYSNPNDTGANEGVENTTGTVTVHTLIPSSWGHPGCWAWKDGGENVFTAWPGEAMTLTGTYYTIEIPAWADYVIINGNSGSTQTADIPVEPGRDIWILIHKDAGYYGLFYQEPTAAELAEYGY